jgi:hypothetical protein
LAFHLSSRVYDDLAEKEDVHSPEKLLESWDSIISDKFIYFA